MKFFLLFFLLIYGIIHGYAYMKTRAVLSIRGWRHLPSFLFILMMVTMPVLTRLFEHSGFESIARIMAYSGYSWMGFIFFFVSAALLMDILGIVYILAQCFLRSAVNWPFSKKISFWLPTLVALLACFYGFFEAGNIQINTVTLITDKLPPERERMRIVQISDLHLGLIVREDKLNKVVAKIKEVNPDLLVSTGDLVDGQLAKRNGLAEIFQQITPSHGKFAVTGNHEFYVGIRQSQDFIKKAGFQLLRGEFVQIENWLTVAGLDDQVPEDVKTARLARLQALIHDHQTGFNEACLGRTMDVLLEKPGRKKGQLLGRSPWLQAVHVAAPEVLLGTVATVKIIDLKPNSLTAILTDQESVAPETKTSTLESAD